MASHPLSWLLRLAVFCHLVLLLKGQHHGVSKCNDTCSAMTSKIPLGRLASYRRREASCGKPAIILTTIKSRTFCADPKEKWVQEAMEYLDRKAAPSLEKQIGLMTAPASRGMDRSPASEPPAIEERSGQEAHRASGTSPEPPRSPTISLAPDGVPSGGPERTELFNVPAATTATTTATTTAAATTTATSWQSSYQPTADLWAEGKASEAASTQVPSTQAPSTQTPSTQAPSSQTPSTQALPTQAGSIQTPRTDTPSTQAPSTQAPSTQTPSTQAPSTQALPSQAGSIQTAPTDTPSSQTPSTQAPSPQAPTISHTAPDPGQDLTPENPLGSSSAHTDAVTRPRSRPHVSVAPSREPVSSGSWAPTPKDPQRLGILTTPITYPEATRRQAVGLLAFLGLLFCLGVAMFTYQRLQGCPRSAVGDMVEGLRYVPRSCGSNSYVLVPV